MQLPGIVTVKPEQTELKAHVVNLLAKAYLDEPWSKTFLDGIKARGPERLEFLTLKFQNLVELGCTKGRVYCLPNGSAAAIVYQHSEQDLDNEYYEGESLKFAEANCSLDANHRYLITSQQMIMGPVSDFGWEEEFTGGNDFIHVTYVAVPAEFRGQGKMKQILKPFFDFADFRRLPVFTETFSDENQALAAKQDFDVLQVLETEMPTKLSIDFGEDRPQVTQDDLFRELQNLTSGGSASEGAMGGMKLKKETVPFSERMMGRRPQFKLL